MKKTKFHSLLENGEELGELLLPKISKPKASKKKPKTAEYYLAPRPRRTWSELNWLLFSRVFFPPLLVWGLAKFIGNWLLGGFISRLVLPAQDMLFGWHYQGHLDRFAEETNKTEKLQAKRIQVHTHDGARLDTIEFSPKHILPPEKRQYLIHLTGNAMCCEEGLSEMREHAHELNCHVIGFNYRGVGQSSSRPYSKDDLITDTIAQVQRLLDQGVDPENITLKGFSLGGAIGTLAAKHFHDRGLKVNIFNDRSFSTITNVAVGQIRKANWGLQSGHQENFFKKLLGWILKPFILFVLALVNWEMDAASAWESIPATHKEHMVVRSSKADREREGVAIVDDPVITHYASLHAANKGERRALKQNIEASLAAIQCGNHSSLSGGSLKEAASHLVEAKARIKERKMAPKGRRDYNAHCEEADKLNGRHLGGSGKEFFYGFYRRVHEHHQGERERVEVESLRVRVN